MKARTRNILLITGAASIVLAVIAGYGIWSIYVSTGDIGQSPDLTIPAQLQETKVFVGADFLEKSRFHKLHLLSFSEILSKTLQTKDELERKKILEAEMAKDLFGFSDIKFCGNEIVAAAPFGGLVLDRSGRLQREFFFEPLVRKIKILWWEQDHLHSTTENLQIVDLDSDGRCEFFSFGLFDGVTVFDHEGSAIWRYGAVDRSLRAKSAESKHDDVDKLPYVLKAAVGDLDGDGQAEYVVAKYADGLRVFDGSGNEKWFWSDSYPNNNLFVVDLDGDRRNELLEAGDNSRVRDGAGNIVREIKGGNPYDAVVLTDAANDRKAVIFCSIRTANLRCVTETDEVYLQGSAPLSEVPRAEARETDISGRPELSYVDDRT